VVVVVKKTAYDLIEALCTISDFWGADIVSDWDDKPIFVGPDEDPLTVYRKWRDAA
jgi:hypothetical protein